jgi:hypothetical protein
MKPHRKIAIVVGALFILATVFALLSSALLDPVIGAPTYLTAAVANEFQVILGALFEVAAGLSLMLIPALLFSLLRQHSEGIALGYFGFRIMEATTLILGALSALLLVTLSQEYLHSGSPATAYYQTLGGILLGLWSWLFPLNPLVFGLGALLLYGLLYQANLLPRWLSAWGFIGALLVFTFGLLGMFGAIVIPLAIPIAVQEMVMALWLIMRGFNPTALVERLV